MSVKVFLDTNIFVYTQSKNELQKREIGLNVIEKYDCCTSTQVFNEICNVMTKKLKMAATEVRQVILAIDERCEVSHVTLETVNKALDIKERYGFSYYDCSIIASAIIANCNYLFSEDLQDGQIISNELEIVNIYNRKNFVN